MANEEHLEILHQGVEVWNQWREENPEIRPDLTEADLSNANSQEEDFSEVDLRGADLHGTDLSRANLNGADLNRANLREADLSQAFLHGANLREADLSQVFLNGAHMSEVDLHGANLREIHMFQSHLYGANLRGADLYAAHLLKANLQEADLRGANLHAARMNEVNLQEADLRGANLREAQLNGAQLYRTNLRKADLYRASCGGTSFSGVDLSEVEGLERFQHFGRSYLDIHTLYLSRGKIPDIFLRGCGIPDDFITFVPSLTGKAIDFYSCFISYSHTDKVFAQRLFDTLQGQGIRCWLDEKQIKPGHDIAREIDRELSIGIKRFLCCSKSAMTEKWWVAFEMKKALAKEQDLARERGQHVRAIIPLDLDGYLLGEYAGEYRSEIMSRSVANFKGYESDISIFDREIERVIAALRTDEGRETPPESKL